MCVCVCVLLYPPYLRLRETTKKFPGSFQDFNSSLQKHSQTSPWFQWKTTHPDQSQNARENLLTGNGGKWLSQLCIGAVLSNITLRKAPSWSEGSKSATNLVPRQSARTLTDTHKQNMNERCIYIALDCVLLYTQSALQSCGGRSLLNHHQCVASTLDDATAVTGQRRQCAHHTPATGGEDRESLSQSSAWGLLGGHDWQRPVLGIWPGHQGYAPTLYEKCHGIFLMTTESQDLGLTSHPKDGAFWQYSVPVTIPGALGPTQTTGWAPPAGLTNTSSNSNLVLQEVSHPGTDQAQPCLASVGNRSWAAGWYGCHGDHCQQNDLHEQTILSCLLTLLVV